MTDTTLRARTKDLDKDLETISNLAHQTWVRTEGYLDTVAEDMNTIQVLTGHIRQDVADIIEAYKDLRKAYTDLQGRIKGLAEKQELSYKEHIKRES